MDDRITTLLREVERNEPSIEWSDVEQHVRLPRSVSERRWPTVVVALSVAAASLAFLWTAIRPYGRGAAAGGRPGAILFDYRQTIATSDVREQRVQIWSVEPDGSDPKVLFDVPEAFDDGALWSPDGSRILFNSSTPQSDGGVFVMNADGSGLTQVLADFRCHSMSWFPDGGSVVCGGGPWREGKDGGNEPAEVGIWRIDLGTGEAVKLLGADYSDPSVSSDGSRIVMVGISGGSEWGAVSELFVANADGSGLRQLTSGGRGHYGEARWSPDGSSLAASWEAVDGNLAYDLYRVDAFNGTRVRLTTWEGWDGSPVWSPDGSQIAFMSDRTAEPAERARWLEMRSGPFEQSVFVMDADGSDVRLIFRGEDFAAPTSWGG